MRPGPVTSGWICRVGGRAGNYFVTSDGRDLFEVMGEAVEFATESGSPLRVH